MKNNYLFNYVVPNFDKHQDNLINLIHKIPNNPMEMSPPKCTVFHTDWNLPKKMYKEYLNYFREHILKDYAKSFCEHFKVETLKFNNIWFQVYRKGDSHMPHTHPQTHFTTIFYIKLPSQKVKTNINSLCKEQLNFEGKEGTIISFPGFFEHESPINNTDDEKIIISFNLDVE